MVRESADEKLLAQRMKIEEERFKIG